MRDAHWPSVCELVAMSDAQLAQQDIGAVNAACATGLPGAELLDVPQCIGMLDEWAGRVRQTTQRYLPRFHLAPAEFDNSEAQFRILCMVTVLQRDLGVRYNSDFMEGPYNATDSRTHFIHGPLTGFGGTCVNLPMLYIAIGRRLGYPLKLVKAREHYFVRWTGHDGERFNIEATSIGFLPYDDAHYHNWPKPLTQLDLDSGIFLRNLTPRQELACFLCERGLVLQDNLLMRDALTAFKSAAELDDQYEFIWATATMITRIHSKLSEEGLPIPNDDFVLQAEFVRASPKVKAAWERQVMPWAHSNLLRIYRLLIAKSNQPRYPKPIPITE